MKRGAVGALALTFVVVTALVAPRVKARTGLGSSPSSKGAYCSGAYADDFAALSPTAREAEQKPQSQSWVYAIRTTATYECLSYAGDGNVRRVRRKALAHGTGFGYRQQNGETYILTNQHVAEWPPVTDDEHKVEDVPPGCKRVSDAPEDRRVRARHLRPRRRAAPARGDRQGGGHRGRSRRTRSCPSCPGRWAARPTSRSATWSTCAASRSGPSRPPTSARWCPPTTTTTRRSGTTSTSWSTRSSRRATRARRCSPSPVARASSSWSACTTRATRATRRSTWWWRSTRCAT